MYKSEIIDKKSLNPYLKILSVLFFLSVYLLLLNIAQEFDYSPIKHEISNLNGEKFSNKYEEYRNYTLSERVFDKMTLDEKIGQLFMLSLPSTSIDQETKSLITDYKIGGVVIMSQNITSKEQLKDYNQNLQKLSDIPLLIATDQEGGTVARIPWDTSRNISQPHIGIVNKKDFAYETGLSHAKSLKESGINLNLAPVLDVDFIKGGSLSSRSFGSSIDTVTALGIELINAHKNTAVLVAPKHFPGIGRTKVDSHYDLPTITVNSKQFVTEEIIPFREAINNGVDIIMVGHAKYPSIDKNYPSSLSKIIINDYLRNLLDFKGIVLTDDIQMDALDDYPDRVQRAITAGNDMILIVDNINNQIEMIEELKEAYRNNEISEEILKNSVMNILIVKYKNKVIK